MADAPIYVSSATNSAIYNFNTALLYAKKHSRDELVAKQKEADADLENSNMESILQLLCILAGIAAILTGGVLMNKGASAGFPFLVSALLAIVWMFATLAFGPFEKAFRKGRPRTAQNLNVLTLAIALHDSKDALIAEASEIHRVANAPVFTGNGIGIHREEPSGQPAKTPATA